MTTPTLVAVAHGSRDPAAREAFVALVGEVRAARPGLEVRGCFLDHEVPRLGQVLALEPDAVVVPVLLGAAYHSGVDIPAVIAAAGARARQAPVLGPDPLLLIALERRLAEVGVPAGDPGTAVVLAAAGSTSASAVAEVAGLARDWSGRGWFAVAPAYASAASPTVADAVAGLLSRGAPRVVVASYLLFPGRFADAVRTEALAAGADAVSRPLVAADSPTPEVAALLLTRFSSNIDHAAGGIMNVPAGQRPALLR